MTVRVVHADSRVALKELADNSVDSCCTDPPYSLVSIQKRFGKPGQAPAQFGTDGRYQRASAGFMGQTWDTGETAHDPAFWAQVLRVLKPGAHLVAFGGTRTYHRLACAIEDAGFEIRDQIGWAFGSGFPKSHDVGGGWGTALKPAWEPICLARKSLSGMTVAANVLCWGTGALNIDKCRIAIADVDARDVGRQINRGIRQPNDGWGYNNALPESGVTVVRPDGRWPANLAHDGSEEVLARFPQTASGELLPHHRKSGNGLAGTSTFEIRDRTGETAAVYGDSGSAARFFYTAKADKDDRCNSKHPTVKPVSLKRWLVRLITPPKGLVIDPFAGSGTTGVACIREGFDCILIEREDKYVADIRHRLGALQGLDAPLFQGPIS
jgi:site-specific DNA-methyltransferase (adenine-specific)